MGDGGTAQAVPTGLLDGGIGVAAARIAAVVIDPVITVMGMAGHR